ncbi:MAG: hypothetical protein P8N43_11480, partial [Alphaproteobacteria bacterium]|nr:hypothetical protein [Alphaproteobacteria bacterium]
IRAFRLTTQLRKVWLSLSWLAIFSMVAIAVGLLPTAIDRLALYLLPLQLFVGSRLPDTGLFGISPISWNYALILMTLASLSLWLLFANHSNLWLPYQNALFLY